MSVDTFKQPDTYKGIEKVRDGLESFFFDIKFNKKKAKYNYHSGLIAGMMVNNMILLKPIIEQGDKADQDIIAKILNQIIPMATTLATDYNWNMDDLVNLTEQFFQEDES